MTTKNIPMPDLVIDTLCRFGPASGDVIARICHVEHVDLIVDACESMCAKGIIVSNRLGVGILEYRPVEINPTCHGDTTHSRFVIFKEVKTRELTNRLRRNKVYTLLQKQDKMLCVYHILDLVQEDILLSTTNHVDDDPVCAVMGLTELHSILYGLLLDKDIFICGPLYGFKKLQD
jgi:hypothetical protein